MLFASFFDDAATGAGFIAASIAIGGFLAHVRPSLSRKDDQAVRSATVVGGLIGCAVAVLIALGALAR